jgi:GNAT superfamily N-acetyltransferase
MKIRQAARHELEIECRMLDQPWFDAVCERLRDLPHHPFSRLLIAEEDGQPRALLGLRLHWSGDGRLVRATISVLEVDPKHNGRGIGSRLIRFAEGIARINGCRQVDVAPDLEGWSDGRCWSGLGYDSPGEGFFKVLESPVRRSYVG